MSLLPDSSLLMMFDWCRDQMDESAVWHWLISSQSWVVGTLPRTWTENREPDRTDNRRRMNALLVYCLSPVDEMTCYRIYCGWSVESLHIDPSHALVLLGLSFRLLLILRNEQSLNWPLPPRPLSPRFPIQSTSFSRYFSAADSLSTYSLLESDWMEKYRYVLSSSYLLPYGFTLLCSGTMICCHPKHLDHPISTTNPVHTISYNHWLGFLAFTLISCSPSPYSIHLTFNLALRTRSCLSY